MPRHRAFCLVRRLKYSTVEKDCGSLLLYRKPAVLKLLSWSCLLRVPWSHLIDLSVPAHKVLLSSDRRKVLPLTKHPAHVWKPVHGVPEALELCLGSALRGWCGWGCAMWAASSAEETLEPRVTKHHWKLLEVPNAPHSSLRGARMGYGNWSRGGIV